MLKVIEQGAYMNQINKIGGGRFTAKTTYLGTRYECDAVIFADAKADEDGKGDVRDSSHAGKRRADRG